MSNTKYFKHISTKWAGRILCFAGGFTDTAGFILLKSIFTASITGNLVKIAYVGAKHSNVTAYVIVTIAYGAGAGMTKILSTFLKGHSYFDMSLIGIIIFATELSWLIISMAVGTYFENAISATDDMNAWRVILTGVLMAISMGTQAGAAANVFTGFPNTTGMTASVATSFAAFSQLVLIYLKKYGICPFFLTHEEKQKIRHSYANEVDEKFAQNKLIYERTAQCWEEFSKQTWPLASFIIGAFTGAITSEHLKFWCLFVPELIVLFMIIELIWQRSEYLSPNSNEDQPGIDLAKYENLNSAKESTPSGRFDTLLVREALFLEYEI